MLNSRYDDLKSGSVKSIPGDEVAAYFVKRAPPRVVFSAVHDQWVSLPPGSPLLTLTKIWEFIRTDNLDVADRVIAEILAAIDALVPFPGRGHRRPDLTSLPLRFILVREYLIA